MGRAKDNDKRAFPMTKEPKWTKGPWALSEGDNGTTRMIYSPVPNQEWGNRGIVISAGTKEIRGEVEYTYLAASDENLNLIAAAPELYEALDGLIKEAASHVMLLSGLLDIPNLKSDLVQDGHKQLSSKLQEGRDALSKALGGTE